MSFATVNGVSLRYDWRAGEGTPLVLLHEMGGALESWDLVCRALPGRGILRMDLRGFGLSEKPVGKVDLADHVGDVIGLIEMLNLKHVHLVGAAVGGAIAIATASELGNRVERLTLLAPATGIPEARRTGVLGLADMLETEGLRGFILGDTVPKAWPTEQFDRTDEGFSIFLATQLGCAPASLAATYRMLAAMDLGPALGALKCPSIWVAGKHDVARTPEAVQAVARDVTGAAFRAIDSSHFMALQTPELVAGLL